MTAVRWEMPSPRIFSGSGTKGVVRSRVFFINPVYILSLMCPQRPRFEQYNKTTKPDLDLPSIHFNYKERAKEKQVEKDLFCKYSISPPSFLQASVVVALPLSYESGHYSSSSFYVITDEVPSLG